MFKVFFYYYQNSPRLHISHLEVMNHIPLSGDIIKVCVDEFFQINKNIKERNAFVYFKVVKREFRMVKGSLHYSDAILSLELLNE